MMDLKDVFCNRVYNRKLIQIALPITLQNLMMALVAAADALMLGLVGQDAMAAVSLATQIQFIQSVLLTAIATGVSVLGAQYWGKKDKDVLGWIFGLGVRESLIVSLPFFAGCFFIPEMQMRLFASDPLLIRLGADYLKIASWSYLPVGIALCYMSIMRVSEHASRSAWISSTAVVLNILLNAIFIFGLCGAPAMGIRGAALATLISRVIELQLCIGSTFQTGYIRLQIRQIFAYHWGQIADFWRYTAPIVGASVLWGVGFAAYTAVMGHLGCDAAAANAIAAVVRDLLCCLCNGISAGVGIIIGNELGAGNLSLGKKYGDRAAILSVFFGLFYTIAVLALIPLVSLFVKLTPQAYDYMVGMFVILSVYMIGRCICTIVLNGVFTAGGDTMFDFVSLIIFMWCIALPCAFLGAFYFHLPVLLVYACTCLDEVGKVPAVLIHFKRYKWVKNLTRQLE